MIISRFKWYLNLSMVGATGTKVNSCTPAADATGRQHLQSVSTCLGVSWKHIFFAKSWRDVLSASETCWKCTL